MGSRKDRGSIPTNAFSEIERNRCAVCQEPLDGMARLLTESAADGTPCRAWRVCLPCHEAILRELHRADGASPSLESAMRAVTRQQIARAANLNAESSDRSFDRLLLWSLTAGFGAPALSFILIIAYVAVAH